VLAIAFPFVAPRLRLPAIAAALATEYLDGALARRFELESRLGRLLDPIADKLFCAMVAGTYLVEDRIAWLELLAVAVRDVVVALGTAALPLLGRWRGFGRMRPRLFGKLTTVLQYAVFLVLAFGREPGPALFAITALVGTLAAVQYVVLYAADPEAAA
jgi:phosphatidylglycerophosphate synthase